MITGRLTILVLVTVYHWHEIRPLQVLLEQSMLKPVQPAARRANPDHIVGGQIYF